MSMPLALGSSNCLYKHHHTYIHTYIHTYNVWGKLEPAALTMRSPGTVQRDGKPAETPVDNAPLTQLSEYHCRVRREIHSAVSLEDVLLTGR